MIRKAYLSEYKGPERITLSCTSLNPESVRVHFLGTRNADRLPLITGRLKPLNLSLITLQRTLSSIVDGSLRVCAVRMSRADVKRMRGGANIFVRRTCANGQIYTSVDYADDPSRSRARL